MVNGWTHVRVRKETHARLVEEARRLHGQTISGRAGVSIYERLDIVSVDTVIRVILDRIEDHRRRGKAKKKESGPDEE